MRVLFLVLFSIFSHQDALGLYKTSHNLDSNCENLKSQKNSSGAYKNKYVHGPLSCQNGKTNCYFKGHPYTLDDYRHMEKNWRNGVPQKLESSYNELKRYYDLRDKNSLSETEQNDLNRLKAKTQSHPDDHIFNWNLLALDYKDAIQSVKNEPKKFPTNCASSLSIDKCFAFRSYCVRNLAREGLVSKLERTERSINLCRSDKYIKANQLTKERCAKIIEDDRKTLEFLKNFNNRLIGIEKGHNIDSQAFFNAVEDKFSKLNSRIDEIEKLIEADKKAAKESEAASNLKKEQDAREQEVQDVLNKCDQLEKYDDNDVKNRNISINLSNAMGVQCESNDLSEKELEELASTWDDIEDKAIISDMHFEMNKAALEKTVEGVISIMILHDKRPEINCGNNCSNTEKLKKCRSSYHKELAQKAPNLYKKDAYKDLIVKKVEDITKQMCSGTYPVKPLSDEVTNNDDKENLDFHIKSLETPIRKINKICQKAKKEHDDIIKCFSCGPRPKTCFNESGNSNISEVDKIQLKSKMESTQNDYECNARMSAANIQIKALSEKSYSELASHYQDLSQSKIAHLFITDEFNDFTERQKKGVDVLSKYCMKNDSDHPGKLLIPPKKDKVKKAMDQFYDLTLGELEKIDTSATNKVQSDKIDSLKSYIKSNPKTVIDLLKNNENAKSYAENICKMVREINQNDFNWRVAEYSVQGVGIVASIALAATGVGAPASAALMLSIAGAEASLIARDAYQSSVEKDQMMSSYATGQVDDEYALNQIGQYEKEIEGVLEDIGMTIGGELIGIGIGKNIFKMLKKSQKGRDFLRAMKKLNPKNSIEHFGKAYKNGLESFQKVVKSNKLSKSILESISKSEKGLQEISAVLGSLSKDAKEKFLLNLNRLSSPNDLAYISQVVSNKKSVNTVLYSNTKSAKKLQENNKRIDTALKNTSEAAAETSSAKGVKNAEGKVANESAITENVELKVSNKGTKAAPKQNANEAPSASKKGQKREIASTGYQAPRKTSLKNVEEASSLKKILQGEDAGKIYDKANEVKKLLGNKVPVDTFNQAVDKIIELKKLGKLSTKDVDNFFAALKSADIQDIDRIHIMQDLAHIDINGSIKMIDYKNGSKVEVELFHKDRVSDIVKKIGDRSNACY